MNTNEGARYYHTRNVGFLMQRNMPLVRFLPWLAYYAVVFVPLRVLVFVLKMKPRVAAAVVRGAVDYVMGRSGNRWS